MAVSTDSAPTDDHPPGGEDQAASSEEQATSSEDQNRAQVDPRAPRFGQTVTALGFGSAIALDLPVLVYLVTAVLVAAVVSSWRVDLYGFLWRRVMVPMVGRPSDREPVAPHRFARVMGAVFGTFGSALLVAGYQVAAYGVLAVVVLLAGLAAATGICVGCRMYRQVQFVQRLGLV